MRPLSVLLVMIALLLAGCAQNGADTMGGDGEAPDRTACEGEAAYAPPLQARFETDLGTFVARLAVDGAPLTVGNFVTLARSGFYDGVLFHRVIEGFMIQTGDPNTKDPSKSPNTWGTGGSTPIQDEFHDDLQHDGPGILSMANSGPNTGSSQFFVTVAPTRHLDNRHAIFGHVVEGMDVVYAISRVDTNDRDRPLENVAIRKVTIEDGVVEAGAKAKPILAHKRIGEGREASFLVLGFNEGTVQDRVVFNATAPEGWTVSPDLACADAIPGAARVSVIRVQPPAGFTGTGTVAVQIDTTLGATATTNLTLEVGPVGDAVALGDGVRGNYAGVLPNGRLFDTSLASVAHDEEIPKGSTFCVRDVPAACNGGRVSDYAPFEFQVGGGVIEGFSALAKGAHEGETPAGRIPPEKAYGTSGGHALSGKTLLFELEIVEVG